jgi:hypothetical protein
MPIRVFPRPLIAVAGLLAVAAAQADVTLRQTSDAQALGMKGSFPTITYIKAGKMRIETEVRGKTRVTIFDVDNQKMYAFESGKTEVDAWDMGAVAAEVAQAVDLGGIVTTLKPNGQTREISGQSAAGFDLRSAVPATLGGPGGLRMTVVNQGTVWIVKDAPGTADYVNFYKAAATRGWIFGDPRAAKGQPGQAKATAEMYRQLAEAGGLPYEVDMNISAEAEGPMAMLAKAMNSQIRSTTQSADVGPLADDLFAPPAGAKVKERK